MTSFRLYSADGTTTNVEILTDLIGLANGSENFTVHQITGADGTTGKLVYSAFNKVKHSVSEIVAFATANNLQLEAIEIGKANTKVNLALGVPAAFSVAVNSATQITATWTKTPGATGYVVTRSTSSTFASSNTVFTLGDVAIKVDTGLTTGTHYYYRIKATFAGAADSPYAFDDDTTS